MGCEICTHLKKLRYPFTLQGSPHFNIIHCSDENLEQITMSKLVAQNQVGYQTHTSFPEFPLTFFFYFRKLHKRRSSMEQAKNNVNMLALKEVLACGGRILRHTGFSRKPQNLYSSDGVHKSNLGNYTFLNNIQEWGVHVYFVLNVSSKHITFPKTLKVNCVKVAIFSQKLYGYSGIELQVSTCSIQPIQVKECAVYNIFIFIVLCQHFPYHFQPYICQVNIADGK